MLCSFLTGFSAGLVKEPRVYTGPHILQLKISDLQGEFGIYNISVFVCDCSETPSCRSRRAAAMKPSFSAIGIVFASLFLLGCKNLPLVSVRETCNMLQQYCYNSDNSLQVDFCLLRLADSAAAVGSRHFMQKRVHPSASR